jgi:hypothetical protein
MILLAEIFPVPAIINCQPKQGEKKNLHFKNLHFTDCFNRTEGGGREGSGDYSPTTKPTLLQSTKIVKSIVTNKNKTILSTDISRAVSSVHNFMYLLGRYSFAPRDGQAYIYFLFAIATPHLEGSTSAIA